MKNLANFKVAVKTREYLIQAIFQMLFSDQKASQIINQFKNEHKNKNLDKLVFIEESLRLSKKFSSPESYKFINASLDKYLKTHK